MKDIINVLESKGIRTGSEIELKNLNEIMESLGFQGLGLDFEIENDAATFYKGDEFFEINYRIIEINGYFGKVKIEGFYY